MKEMVQDRFCLVALAVITFCLAAMVWLISVGDRIVVYPPRSVVVIFEDQELAKLPGAACIRYFEPYAIDEKSEWFVWNINQINRPVNYRKVDSGSQIDLGRFPGLYQVTILVYRTPDKVGDYWENYVRKEYRVFPDFPPSDDIQIVIR